MLATERFTNLDWKRLLNIGQDEIVLGLDIGSYAVKMIELRKDGDDYIVTAAGMVDIAETTEDDEAQGEINTVGAIGECLRSTGTQTQLAVCGVSGPEVAVRYFNFPPLPAEEIEGAILLHASPLRLVAMAAVMSPSGTIRWGVGTVTRELSVLMKTLEAT